MRLCALLFILAVAVTAHAWQCYHTAGALIYVPYGQAGVAKRVQGIVHAELPRLAQAVGNTRRLAPIPIYVYLDSVTFRRDIRGSELVRGVTSYPSGKISVDANTPIWDFQHVVTHEMVHNLVNQRLGKHVSALPVWVNEGLAESLSSPFPFRLTRWATLPFLATPALPLPQLPDAFKGADAWRCETAYLQSGAMVNWLEATHPGALRQALGGTAEGRPFAAEMVRACALTPAAWLNRWRADDRRAEQHGRYLLYALLGLWVLLITFTRIRRYVRSQR